MESELLATVMFLWQGSLLHLLEHNDSITKAIQITIAELLKCFLITISIYCCNKLYLKPLFYNVALLIICGVWWPHVDVINNFAVFFMMVRYLVHTNCLKFKRKSRENNAPKSIVLGPYKLFSIYIAGYQCDMVLDYKLLLLASIITSPTPILSPFVCREIQ